MSYCFSFLFFCVVTIRNTGIKFACSNVVERKDNTLKNQLLVTSRSQSVRPSSSALQNYSFDSTTPEYGLDLPVYYKRMQGVVASVNGFFLIFTMAFPRQKVSFSVTSFLFPCLIKNASTAFSLTELAYLAYQMLEEVAEAQKDAG